MRSDAKFGSGTLDDIAAGTKQVSGDDCQVAFQFLDDIQVSASGKYRHIMSEVST